MKIEYSPNLGIMILLGKPHEFAQLRSKLMKPTSGFLTDDGNFFETNVEATYHEAETRLKEALIQGSDFDESSFIVTLENLAPQIREYLDAYTAKSALDKSNFAASKDPETFQSFEAGSSGTVSDVGGGERSTAVPRSESGDGVGDGRHDASSVRGGESVAIDVSTEPPEACTGYGDAIIRDGTMDPIKKVLEQEDKGR